MISELADAMRTRELPRATYAGVPLGPMRFVEGLENVCGRQGWKVRRSRKAERAVSGGGQEDKGTVRL